MAGRKYCSPKCKFFRCDKRSIVFRRTTVWCKWTEEECDVANCNYAMCVKRRLLQNGICGETVKRKTKEIRPEEEQASEIKLRGKALRRIGKGEIF